MQATGFISDQSVLQSKPYKIRQLHFIKMHHFKKNSYFLVIWYLTERELLLLLMPSPVEECVLVAIRDGQLPEALSSQAFSAGHPFC